MIHIKRIKLIRPKILRINMPRTQGYEVLGIKLRRRK